MNPNIPYGQQMPMPPYQRRHDIPHGQGPPQMRPHPGYQHYYAQPMGPVVPQYQHYQQSWYPPYQQQIPQYHGGRHPYYQPPLPPPPQMPQHHGPLIVSSQPQMSPTPRTFQGPPTVVPPPASSSISTTSGAQVETPPSRPLSTTSASQIRPETASPVTSVASGPQSLQVAVLEPSPPLEPFTPPIPWLSVEDQPFPPRAIRRRRRILRSSLGTEPVIFPQPEQTSEEIQTTATATSAEITEQPKEEGQEQVHFDAPPLVETPTLPSDAPSETLSTQPTTPSSSVNAVAPKAQQPSIQTKATRTAIPVVPVVPIIPPSPTAARKMRTSVASTKSTEEILDTNEELSPPVNIEGTVDTEQTAAPSTPSAPKSWADLVRTKGNANAAASVALVSSVSNGLAVPRTETLGDVLGEISISDIPSKIAFLQPRGLVNTGNMCYMNSVLQALVFCNPFYEFLGKVAQKATHNFKSNTPLIDAMIMFMKEYHAIDTASTVEQLRLRLKPDDFENYGDPLRPEYVYDTINKLPRFRDMRRGHQQDAQEFLGFLLEELHEECAYAMQRSGTSTSSGRSTPVGSISNLSETLDTEAGWLEVGHKQKAAVTRSSGAIATESPVTGIFGGKLRSELKISGNKMSVTLEPYQPLQLDIGSPSINNIVDALKGLTRPESMQGDFLSSRGVKASATKQVFIETLPPVLILHLKRFQYDSSTKRAEKIWKKVGYPLELEIPKEVFPASTRNKLAAHGGLPKYRLTSVIYHHGKYASGGHYTVDIRRQDGKEWIRLDDTLIRRIRSEDVAEGGSEEDPKVLAAALDRHKKQDSTNTNRFEQIDADEKEDDDTDTVWSQVNGHARSKSTMSSILNGTATPVKNSSGPQTPRYKESVKENKVAYLLFYQRITG